MRLRVINWNMAGARPNWEAVGRLARSDVPTVVLLQEAKEHPASFDRDDLTVMSGGSVEAPWAVHAGYARSGGTAIAANNLFASVEKIVPVPLAETTGEHITTSHPGSFTAANLRLHDGTEVTVVSAYAVWETAGPTWCSEATFHRTISDLTPLLLHPPGAGLVIAGDFNAYYRYGDAEDARYMTVFNRLEAYDMTFVGPQGDAPLARCRCKLGDDCRHVHTYLHHKKPENNALQLDFVYASSHLATHALSCGPVEGSAFDLSDHLPIVTVFDWADRT